MRTIAAMAVSVCLYTGLAQENRQLPTASEVLDAYVRALGGRQALQGVTSRGAMGSFQSPTYGSYGRYEEFTKLPGRLIRTIHVPGYGVVQRCFDGVRGWEESPEYGVEELSGARLSEIRRDAALESPLQLSQVFSKLKVARRAQVDLRDAYEVLAETPDGAVETLSFDVESGLMVRRELLETARDGSVRRVRTYFEDYRAVDGIQIAHTLRYEREDLIWIVKRGVANTVPIDDQQFRKP